MRNMIFFLFISLAYLSGHAQIKITLPPPLPDSINQALIRSRAAVSAKDLATLSAESKRLDSLVSRNRYSEASLNSMFTKSINYLFPKETQPKKDKLRYMLINETMDRITARLAVMSASANASTQKEQNRLSELVSAAVANEQLRYDLMRSLLSKWPASRF